MRFVAPIVEGHGEVEALPALLHRIALVVSPDLRIRVNPPIRVKSGSFLNDDHYFHKMFSLAAAKAVQEGGLVLMLLDCEDDCPAVLGPRLLQRAHGVRADIHVLVVLAYREFESWFIAAARSLRGFSGLPASLRSPADMERVRNAKGWLGERMPGGYDPLLHQLKLARRFDLSEARANRSFDRFYIRLLDLLER
jgi:hypothetical protein